MRSTTQTGSHKQSVSPFKREHLPVPSKYYRDQGLKLTGRGPWKNGLCPFHTDKRPSLRVNVETGGFRCMACGARGGDVLDYHMQRYDLPFPEAAKELGVWETGK